jgi:hypothetical protein
MARIGTNCFFLRENSRNSWRKKNLSHEPTGCFAYYTNEDELILPRTHRVLRLLHELTRILFYHTGTGTAAWRGRGCPASTGGVSGQGCSTTRRIIVIVCCLCAHQRRLISRRAPVPRRRRPRRDHTSAPCTQELNQFFISLADLVAMSFSSRRICSPTE